MIVSDCCGHSLAGSEISPLQGRSQNDTPIIGEHVLTALLKLEVKLVRLTGLFSESMKYICDNIPDKEDVEPAKVFSCCFASLHSS